MGKKRGMDRRQQVEALVRRLEPEIIELFRSHRVEPAVAAAVLEEALTLLLYRWPDLSKPEIWLLEILDRRLHRLEGRS